MANIIACTESSQYKLRAGTLQFVCAENSENCECAEGRRTVLVLQTFGAEYVKGKVFQAATTLPESMDFIGMNKDGSLASANFQASQYTTLDGKMVWAGSQEEPPTYVSEDQIPGIAITNAGMLFGVT